MFLEKILPQQLCKTSLSRSIKNAQYVYKHNENKYLVHIGNKNDQHFEDTGQNNSELSFPVDRKSFIYNVLTSILHPKSNSEQVQPEKIVIDFSSPNIAKPFHVGHLRSTIIGNFIANINTYFNNQVTKINYLGDWGTQFGLLQYGLRAKNIDVAKLKNDAIKTLYDVYVHANQLAATDDTVRQEARKYFTDIEQGRASLANWKRIRETTVTELENVYQRLGIKFDAYHWESDYNGGSIKDLMSRLEAQHIINTDESGKKVVNINDRNITILKSDNSTLYLARDVAALIDRYSKYQFDKMLYVVDNAQTDHFAAVFEVVKQIDAKCTEGCEHIKFGRIKGMSTRTGNVVFLNDILDEALRKMHEKQHKSKNTRSAAMNQKTCDILGTTAVIINDLKQKRQKDYMFDWERTLQSEGDSGIKLQYLHCRLCSLEQNSGASIPEVCEPNYLPEEIIGVVIAELAKFENILQKSRDENEACILVNYLFRLARHINRMFNEIKVKNVSSDIASQRLLVFHCSKIVVKTSLEILGVRPLKEM